MKDLFLVENIDKIRSNKNGKIYKYYTKNEKFLVFEKNSQYWKIFEDKKLVMKPKLLKKYYFDKKLSIGE